MRLTSRSVASLRTTPLPTESDRLHSRSGQTIEYKTSLHSRDSNPGPSNPEPRLYTDNSASYDTLYHLSKTETECSCYLRGADKQICLAESRQQVKIMRRQTAIIVL
jgi:hypothetical protein